MTTTRSLTWIPTVVAVLGMTFGCGHDPATTPRILSSGRTINVISILMMPTSDPALMLTYQTDLKVDDASNLQKEVDDVWTDFRKDVETAKLNSAVIAAREAPTGHIITHSKNFGFAFHRASDGTWAPVVRAARSSGTH